MVSPKLFDLTPGAARWTGPMDAHVQFAMEHQLMNEKTWADFVRVFHADSDDHDDGWRGEYWGKMMRGACLTYRYNGDEALYRVLDTTVRDMLAAQRADGRFSTYSADNQLHGWDMWGRKYILTSMLHFYDICRDETLKKRILDALCAHMDAIVAAVGDGEGQIPITQTSHIWGGVNSASILDAVIDLYRHTGKESYLKFAQYILSTGGCVDGDLIALALENQTMPFQYPEVKAYETMSFFEGVLSYYELTGETRYLRAVLNFTESVNETDITAIGCSGCTHELFDNSAVKQVLYSDGIMQETCVTVTWMRLLAKLFLLTGEEKYMDRMERSAWNALYGSVNTGRLPQFSMEEKAYVEALPFDSYSPLYNSPRGRGIGGFKRFSFGGYYGCCACIASAGIAIFPLCAALRSDDGICFSSFPEGTLSVRTPSGSLLNVKTHSGYPVKGEWSAELSPEKPERLTVRIRIPQYFGENYTLLVNGVPVDETAENGFVSLNRLWNPGDNIRFQGVMAPRTLRLGGRTAFTYGPIVLARDSGKEAGADLEEILEAENCPLIPCEPLEGELVRFLLPTADGRRIPLTDYASCGKNWLDKHNRISVWLNLKEEEL